jgi:hypothetical protein
VGIGRPAVIPASTPPVTQFQAPQVRYPAAGSKTASDWSIRRLVGTARRYRTIEIQASNHTITAADPLPDDLHTAAAITQGAH